MANTPRGYPYPALSDAPAGPVQLQALAQAIDSDVGTVVEQRTPIAIVRVRTTSGTITVTDGVPLDVSFYNQGVTYENDPLGLIDFADGVFTLKAKGMWDWSISALWDAYTATSDTPVHYRSLYIRKSGASQDEGRSDVPFPARTGWGTIRQATNGTVNTADTSSTIKAVLYQNAGRNLVVTDLFFTVRLASLD